MHIVLIDCLGSLPDINECEEDRGICQHNCTNNVGSYQCSCPPGYRLSVIDGRTCEGLSHNILLK